MLNSREKNTNQTKIPQIQFKFQNSFNTFKWVHIFIDNHMVGYRTQYDKNKTYVLQDLDSQDFCFRIVNFNLVGSY